MNDKDFAGRRLKDSQIIFSYLTCMLFFKGGGHCWCVCSANPEYRKDFNYIFLPILERVEGLLREQLEGAITEDKQVKVKAPSIC